MYIPHANHCATKAADQHYYNHRQQDQVMHRRTYKSITYRILAYELAAVAEMKAYRDERWLPVLLKMDELAAQQ